jgi:hypothetical protein
MRVTERRLAGLGIGVLAYFVVRKQSRRERRRALREAIYRSYEAAAADPEFMAEHEELTRALDHLAADGLGREGAMP